jgi:hypothetical protein
MSRELRVHAVCDITSCGNEFIVEPGEEPVIVRIDGKEQELDLCPNHKDDLRFSFLGHARPATISRITRKNQPRKKSGVRRIQPDEYPCPVVGCRGAGPYSTAKSLGDHLKGAEKWPGDKISEYMSTTHGTRTMPRFPCPECGDKLAKQNLSRHRKSEHGVEE